MQYTSSTVRLQSCLKGAQWIIRTIWYRRSKNLPSDNWSIEAISWCFIPSVWISSTESFSLIILSVLVYYFSTFGQLFVNPFPILSTIKDFLNKLLKLTLTLFLYLMEIMFWPASVITHASCFLNQINHWQYKCICGIKCK